MVLKTTLFVNLNIISNSKMNHNDFFSIEIYQLSFNSKAVFVVVEVLTYLIDRRYGHLASTLEHCV